MNPGPTLESETKCKKCGKPYTKDNPATDMADTPQEYWGVVCYRCYAKMESDYLDDMDDMEDDRE